MVPFSEVTIALYIDGDVKDEKPDLRDGWRAEKNCDFPSNNDTEQTVVSAENHICDWHCHMAHAWDQLSRLPRLKVDDKNDISATRRRPNNQAISSNPFDVP
jgi:hypothetical protein